jgi:hypothetical protein
LALVTLTPEFVLGESDDYMIAAISMQNHLSSRITEQDIRQAQTDFPGVHADNIKKSWESEITDLPPGSAYLPFLLSPRNNERYPAYFFTYSVAALPAKNLLKALNLKQSYAFGITNVLAYIFAFFFVYKYLAANRKTVFLTLLALAILPVQLYLLYPSAEIFIFSIMICAAVSYFNKKYILSVLFISVAGSLNPTAMFMAVCAGLSYIYETLKTYKFNALSALKSEYRGIIKMALALTPFLFSLIYTYFILGTFVAQMAVLPASFKNLLPRFFAYLFDLNLGFFPYLPLFLILFFICLILSIYKKNIPTVLFTVGFFVTVLAYSMHGHINCGMAMIARYNAWLSPVLIIGVAAFLPTLFNPLQGRVMYLLLSISILSSSALYVLDLKSGSIGNSERISAQAKFVLNNFPALYNPYPYTFIARTAKIHGGYWTAEQDGTVYKEVPIPFIYEKASVRKILVPKGYAARLSDMIADGRIVGDEKSLIYLQKNVDKLTTQTKDFKYINVPRKYELTYLNGSPLKNSLDDINSAKHKRF